MTYRIWQLSQATGYTIQPDTIRSWSLSKFVDMWAYMALDADADMPDHPGVGYEVRPLIDALAQAFGDG